MPYTNIVWIKLFLSLLTEDDRFLYQLNESQQLLYVKLLMLAGITSNNITKRPQFIKNHINYPHTDECLIKDISRILEVFPKFKEGENSYSFENFDELHNRISYGKVGSSQDSAVGSSHSTTRGTSQIKNKIKNKNIYEHLFDSIYDKYPRKLGKKEALKHFNASVNTEQDAKDIESAVNNYNRYISENKVEEKFIKHASSWFNNWRDWVNYKPKQPERRVIA